MVVAEGEKVEAVVAEEAVVVAADVGDNTIKRQAAATIVIAVSIKPSSGTTLAQLHSLSHRWPLARIFESHSRAEFSAAVFHLSICRILGFALLAAPEFCDLLKTHPSRPTQSV